MPPPHVINQPAEPDLRALEMEEARRIQVSLLPTGPLRGSNFEIACRFWPFADVSGDLADYFDLPNGRVGIYLGDAVGKGLPAAMYGAMVMGTLRAINKSGEDLPQFWQRCSRAPFQGGTVRRFMRCLIPRLSS